MWCWVRRSTLAIAVGFGACSAVVMPAQAADFDTLATVAPGQSCGGTGLQFTGPRNISTAPYSGVAGDVLFLTVTAPPSVSYSVTMREGIGGSAPSSIFLGNGNGTEVFTLTLNSTNPFGTIFTFFGPFSGPDGPTLDSAVFSVSCTSGSGGGSGGGGSTPPSSTGPDPVDAEDQGALYRITGNARFTSWWDSRRDAQLLTPQQRQQAVEDAEFAQIEADVRATQRQELLAELALREEQLRQVILLVSELENALLTFDLSALNEQFSEDEIQLMRALALSLGSGGGTEYGLSTDFFADPDNPESVLPSPFEVEELGEQGRALARLDPASSDQEAGNLTDGERPEIQNTLQGQQLLFLSRQLETAITYQNSLEGRLSFLDPELDRNGENPGGPVSNYVQVQNAFSRTSPPGLVAIEAATGRVGFSTSLRDVRSRILATHALANQPGAVLATALPGLLGDERFNIWAYGAYNYTDDRRSGVQGDATSIMVHLGVSYRFAGAVTLGVKARYSGNQSERDDGSAETETDGYGFAVFAEFELPYGAIGTVLGAYERSNSDLEVVVEGTPVTGSFSTDTFTLGGSLSRRFSFEQPDANASYYIDPNISVSFVSGNRGAYTRSDAVQVAGERVQAGSLAFAPTFGVVFTDVSPSIASVQPTLSVSGVWNLRRADSFLAANGSVVETPVVSVGLSAGLDLQFTNGWHATLSASHSGFGSDVSSTGVSGRVGVQF